MKKFIVAVIFFVSFFSTTSLDAQNGIVQEGEFGIGLGAGHYFGDLNTKARLNRPKVAASVFFRKNFGNYIALRVGASFAQLGYSDQYNTHNTYMYSRNLSFNSKVWELSLQGDFNFFRFMPGEPEYSFTPYITFGAGIFTYDPYAYLKGEKIYNSGDTLNAMEMFNRSIDFSSQAAELDSMSIPIFMNRAATYIYMKKFDLAALDYNKILKLDPQNTEILEKRAFAYYKSSQWIKAIKDLDKLIFLNPDNSLMLLNRAKAKYNMEFFKEAIDDFNILVRLDPQNANAYYFLAVCYRRLDDSINAMLNVEKAKQLGFPINEKELKKFCKSHRIAKLTLQLQLLLVLLIMLQRNQKS